MAVRRRVGAGIVSALVVTGALVASAQDGLLRYKWTAGEALKYRMTQDITVNMSGIPGVGDMLVTTSIAQDFTQTARSVAAGGSGTIDMTFDVVKVNLSAMGQSMAYDSTSTAAPANPMAAEMSKVFGSMIGKTVTMVMSPLGSLEKVEGMSKLMAGMQPGGIQGGAVGNPLDGMMTDEAMRATFGQGFAALPERPVKLGDTWVSSLSVPNPFGNVAMTLTNTHRGVDSLNGRAVVKIGTATVMKPVAGGAPAQPPAGLPMTVTLGEGTGETETLFDPKLGQLVRAIGTTTLPMTMRMDAPDGTTLDLQASTKVVMTIEQIVK